MSLKLKKIVYQLAYRGSKELDFLCAKIDPSSLSDDEQDLLLQFLNEPEKDIEDWLLSKKEVPECYSALLHPCKFIARR
jgi:succinate dehydrogenase flavin-adding protein (antitoxin of CptAB toxin-antitoxin module)